MSVTKRELIEVVNVFGEQIRLLDESIAKIGAGLSALKAILAMLMNPSAPMQVLRQIEELENEFEKLDPSVPARQRVAEIIETAKTWQKHSPSDET